MLDFAEQFCARIFCAVTADGWNFGLCATIPRKPRQARKGATVADLSRVPRSTRSSSHRFAVGPPDGHSLDGYLLRGHSPHGDSPDRSAPEGYSPDRYSIETA